MRTVWPIMVVGNLFRFGAVPEQLENHGIDRITDPKTKQRGIYT